MLRNSSFSEFFHHKRQQECNAVVHTAVNGSLAEEVKEEKVAVICRAPSRTWWEQAWQLRSR